MEFIKKYLSESLSFLLGFALAFVILSFYKDNENQKDIKKAQDNLAQEVKIGENNKTEIEKISSSTKALAQTATTTSEVNYDFLKVSDQKPGDSVDIAYAKAKFPFWLVVHTEKNGKIWNALGARMKKAGEYTGVTVPLLAKTQPGKRYWVIIYKDNGDGKFDLNTDFPALDKNGNFKMLSFKTVE